MRTGPGRPAARVAALAAALTGVLLLGGCSGGDRPAAGSSPSPSVLASTTAPPAPPPTATAVPAPPATACYALSYAQAIAPTTRRRSVPCSAAHTAATYAVGRLDTVVDGHLLAVDSDRVQAEVAATCPERFAAFVGGGPDDRALSMLRPVWFTPTVHQSDAGADWYRCDVVALAGDDRLAPLSGPLRGVLDSSTGRDRYGMCGTAQPGSPGFRRVICSAPHAWRAVGVVAFPDGPYPGAAAARAAGDGPCRDAGAAAAGGAAAGGALDYEWGYEWPSAAQWRAGQHVGRCWVPD